MPLFRKTKNGLKCGIYLVSFHFYGEEINTNYWPSVHVFSVLLGIYLRRLLCSSLYLLPRSIIHWYLLL